MFITVRPHYASSLQKEYRDRDWRASGEVVRPVRGHGLPDVRACLGVIPLVGPFCTIAAITTCFIIYWIQIADYSSRHCWRRLALRRVRGRREDDDDYGRDRERGYDDDEPRPRRDRREREDRDRDDRHEDDRDRDYDYRRRRD